MILVTGKKKHQIIISRTVLNSVNSVKLIN